jgi:hypothetical protein
MHPMDGLLDGWQVIDVLSSVRGTLGRRGLHGACEVVSGNRSCSEAVSGFIALPWLDDRNSPEARACWCCLSIALDDRGREVRYIDILAAIGCETLFARMENGYQP